MEFSSKGFTYLHEGKNSCEVYFTSPKAWSLALQMVSTNFVFKDSRAFRWLMAAEGQNQYNKKHTVFWFGEGSMVVFMRQLDNGHFTLSRVTSTFLIERYLKNNFDDLEKSIQWIIEEAIKENNHA